ncbi:addiction module toxin, HicA family protein [Spirochaetia bacterium]|nr:addiction module toxin, HicA family protein [Spirochaetia bacterium]
MAEYEKRIREQLSKNGCQFVRHGKGDHDIWHSPITNNTFPVAVKIKSRYMANVILKQAGIDYHF